MATALKDGILAGKTAFVAGGSSGINLGVAFGFAEAGAKVALISRSPAKIEAAAQQLRDAGHDAVGFAADVRDFAAIERSLAATRERYGEIDIVLSGAAGNFVAPALNLSANGFKTVVDIDLLGTFNVFRASFEYLRRPGASLIAITAGQAVRPMANQIHACAAKAGGQYGDEMPGARMGAARCPGQCDLAWADRRYRRHEAPDSDAGDRSRPEAHHPRSAPMARNATSPNSPCSCPAKAPATSRAPSSIATVAPGWAAAAIRASRRRGPDGSQRRQIRSPSGPTTASPSLPTGSAAPSVRKAMPAISSAGTLARKRTPSGLRATTVPKRTAPLPVVEHSVGLDPARPRIRLVEHRDRSAQRVGLGLEIEILREGAGRDRHAAEHDAVVIRGIAAIGEKQPVPAALAQRFDHAGDGMAHIIADRPAAEGQAAEY